MPNRSPIESKINTLRPRQNGRHFPDDIFKWISLIENVWISIEISLNFVPMGPINNIPALVQIMAWRRPGDKPLSEPMMVKSLTHINVTRPQWVNTNVSVVKTIVDWLILRHGCGYRIHTFEGDVIIHTCPNINGSLSKLSFMWGEWMSNHTTLFYRDIIKSPWPYHGSY